MGSVVITVVASQQAGPGFNQSYSMLFSAGSVHCFLRVFGAFSLVALFPSQFKDMQLIGNSCLCVSPVIDLPSVQSAGLYCS